MIAILRHLLAILVLPLVMTVLIPLWIARAFDIELSHPTGLWEVLLLIGGIDLILAGSAVFSICLLWFASRGRGTLAPWDPPRKLVVDGPYRFVRNPMISGVIMVLWGEVLLLRSGPHAIWAAAFLVMNLILIPLVEEPQLEARFGRDYREYRKQVPRFFPRVRFLRDRGSG